MSIKIIRATDPIVVKNVRVLIYGQPGLGKTSMAFTARTPLCLDFDKGSHRSKQRKDVLEIDQWADVMELMKDAATLLAAYDTIIVDTVGRCLDIISQHLMRENYKLGNKNGALTMQGWGELKGVFGQWMRQLTLLGKDVILIAHDKEDKDGDTKYLRPDVQGGSYAEVMKTVDFAGYLQMVNNQRNLNFNPTDRWIGKNAADLPVVSIPDFAEQPDYFARVIEHMKRSLSTTGTISAEVSDTVTTWRDTIDGFVQASEFNAILPQVNSMTGTVKVQVGALIKARREKLKIIYNKELGLFEDPVRETAPAPAPVTTASATIASATTAPAAAEIDF